MFPNNAPEARIRPKGLPYEAALKKWHLPIGFDQNSDANVTYPVTICRLPDNQRDRWDYLVMHPKFKGIVIAKKVFFRGFEYLVRYKIRRKVLIRLKKRQDAERHVEEARRRRIEMGTRRLRERVKARVRAGVRAGVKEE